MEQRNVDFTDHACLECGQRCSNRRSIGNHINRSHDMSIEAYVLKHFCGGVVPKCLCGCGLDVRWHKSQYYYCDFLSGHNGSGFSSTNQPKFSAEQIARRNESIRRAYSTNTKISGRISNSLIKAFSDPATKDRLSRAQKQIWSDDVYKARMTEIRKRVWDEQHDDLCKKIFTPEFGRKISAANMRRDMRHTSKEEHAFINRLVDVLGQKSVISDGMWVNDPTDGAAHFDVAVMVDDQSVLVEYDGTFYHGLDRDSGFALTQLVHIANDFRKNRIAANAGYALVRMPGTVDVGAIGSFADVITLCRHHQYADGTVAKDGMFRFSDDDQPIMTREQLIRSNESELFPGAPGRDHTRDAILPAIKEFFREYVRARGWIYPMSNCTLATALASIRKHEFDRSSSSVSSLTTAGSDYLKRMFRSFWDVDGGPAAAFNDDKRLHAVLSYRLGLNGSIPYAYELSDGTHVECRETFDINPKNIRKGFIVQRSAVSWFKPTAAYEIYRRFLSKDDPVVWDPSCGFGARLLGFAAAFPRGTYIGTDPASLTFRDLTVLEHALRVECPSLTIGLSNTGSESFVPDRRVDLVFTSPPYFDKERYFNEPTQCWNMFPSLTEWVDGYLRPTFFNAFGCLLDDGAMVINVNNDLRDVTVSAAESVGFVLERTLQLGLGKHAFARKTNSHTAMSEPLLVFRKHSL